jgi:hypothetical protein
VQVNNEVHQITGKDVQRTVKSFFTPVRVDKLLKFIKARKLKAGLEEVISSIGKSNNFDLSGMSYVLDLLTNCK